ncbi:hypothetical protein FC62_GL001366 [Amylolactobacillus amylotrophicus DSM 20534]|uniref:Uncharacterized protein n=2 Tax=Amylolactobacillus TaxID=2767876 RepID=A0A0R1YH77_9LACO|nr:MULTISPECIES: LPXTG cell wall anchor domain-containing protein [Amylolactobacillus]KRK37251.1 hypothetical protein FC62_GL001366 [Amylolactobacillus amylotrophicus DSM 20534]KRM41650.1 hypothetical protein FD40_GL001212 [Amylolactobacillus amylophilus DSM 20533 = JCM 1125]GED80751.1 hypothetical protein LAM01_12240 [Amylolactobacillus amylophilus]
MFNLDQGDLPDTYVLKEYETIPNTLPITGSNTRALLLSGLTLVLISGISIFGFRLHRRNKQDLAALEQVLKK